MRGGRIAGGALERQRASPCRSQSRGACAIHTRKTPGPMSQMSGACLAAPVLGGTPSSDAACTSGCSVRFLIQES